MLKDQYPVHLETSVNGDASGGLVFKVFKGGSTVDITATVLTSKFNGVAITDIEMVTEAGGELLLVADADADGKHIAGGVFRANGGVGRSLSTPHYCPAGVLPKLIGPATGKTRCILHGFLYRT